MTATDCSVIGSARIRCRNNFIDPALVKALVTVIPLQDFQVRTKCPLRQELLRLFARNLTGSAKSIDPLRVDAPLLNACRR